MSVAHASAHKHPCVRTRIRACARVLSYKYLHQEVLSDFLTDKFQSANEHERSAAIQVSEMRCSSVFVGCGVEDLSVEFSGFVFGLRVQVASLMNALCNILRHRTCSRCTRDNSAMPRTRS